MAVPTTYMLTANHIPNILSSIQDAGVPPRFTQEFLKSIGHSSSNDRAIIGVLKSLGFLDQSGVPTDRYRAYRNKSEAPYILAAALREAYSDLFLANERAQELPADRIKGILATRVDKGDAVLKKMAATFRSLAGIAKWDRSQNGTAPRGQDVVPAEQKQQDQEEQAEQNGTGMGDVRVQRPPITPEYHYNIQIHLPATKEVSVYNAIFKSLREHLL
jgi:Family of unknown function (DUF5343)